MVGVIVCSGSIDNYESYKKYFNKRQFVICVDGGARHVRKLGLTPDILVGDLDSISQDDLNYFKKSKIEILSYPAKKDMTDTDIAVELAMDKGCEHIIILGGLGTRLDHSLANIFILKRALDKGVEATVINEMNEIRLIKNSIALKRESNEKVTLLPATHKVEGVTTKGLKYPLYNATMFFGSTWGVSNEFEEDTAEVSITSGLLFVIKSKE